MTAELKKASEWQDETERPVEIQLANDPVLPEISQATLECLFDRLSDQDKINLLQQKIIPVAYFPNQTLYAAAGAWAHENAARQGWRVIADVQPGQLATAIRRKLGCEILRRATYSICREHPEQSAFHRISLVQGFGIAALTTLVILACIQMSFEHIYAGMSMFFGLFFLSVVSLRVLCLVEKRIHQKAPPLLPDEELPNYSVLVPVFRETQVLDQLIGALNRLDYPAAKLDIKLVLEENDIAMHRAVAALHLSEKFDVIIVPAGKPQTKPRALNYALQFARGTYVTIYDAEDIPEPMQLRKAAALFAASGPNVVCLQAELAFFNANENWLTRQFTVEYAMLFKLLLPAFVRERLPLPLGGTSNHFRISILRDLCAWDPFNVTEDADLGIRLARHGYATVMLDSITYEEATSGLRNWIHQRARWLKGFMQTFFVHSRQPVALVHELGFFGAFAALAFTCGVVVSALLHPLFLIYALYKLCTQSLGDAALSPFMTSVLGINFVVFAIGYGCSMWAGNRALAQKQIFGWWHTILTIPVYWLLMSFAGWVGLWQFLNAPHQWNKTAHGKSKLQKT